MFSRRCFILFLSVVFLFCGNAFGQPKKKESESGVAKTRILFILDCSSSMWGKWQSDSKIKVTQAVLNRFLDSVETDSTVQVALRVFGHLNKNAFGTRLEVPFEKNNILKIKNKIKTLVPKGNCTVASALSNSLNDFPSCNNCRNLVVIITDGVDDCEGDICSVSVDIQRSGTITKTFVIGIGNKDSLESNYDCAGPFYSVKNEDNFISTLRNLENVSLSQAHVLVKLLDSHGNPTETNIPLTFYDRNSGLVKYNFIHALTPNSLPDTFLLDPLITYDLTIHTVPPIILKNLTFDPYQMNVITAKAPQGSLIIKPVGKTNLPDMNANIILKEAGKNEIIGWQNLNEKREYSIGKYDVEILSLPRLQLKNVEIFQSSVTRLEIPTQGLVIINKGKDIVTGYLFAQKDDDKLEWVCPLDENKAVENLYLLPGKYFVVIRTKNKGRTSDSMVREFRIESGQTTNVIFGK